MGFISKDIQKEDLLHKKQFQLFVFLLLITFLGDILRRFSFLLEYDFKRYTTISKIIFIVASLIFIFFYLKKEILKNKKKINILKAMSFLVLFFVVGQIALNNSNILYHNIINNLEFLTKYLFFPYLLVLFINLRERQDIINKLIRVFEIIFFVNLIAIVLGFIFQIKVFNTYDYGIRFGYKGIFSMSGQTSFYFILMILYYIHRLIFFDKNKWTLIKLVILIIVSFLIGTKRIYFFLPMLSLYYLFFLNGFKNRITYITIVPVSLIGISLFYIFKDRLEDTILLFKNIYLENGIITSLLSFRNELLIKIYSEQIIDNWRFLNFLFGGANFQDIRSQMGFVDLFLFFGIFGLITYLYFYRQIFNFNFSNSFYWFFLITLIIITFLSDAIILDTNVPVLLFLITSYFYYFEKSITKNV